MDVDERRRIALERANRIRSERKAWRATKPGPADLAELLEHPRLPDWAERWAVDAALLALDRIGGQKVRHLVTRLDLRGGCRLADLRPDQRRRLATALRHMAAGHTVQDACRLADARGPSLRLFDGAVR